MLTRFVRIQLIIFTTLSIIGMVTMALVYLQAPTLLGIGRMTVTVELPNSGGLYRFANVTYRGVQIGKVTAVGLTDGVDTHTQATLRLDSTAKIPADLQAEVRSISAVGEQYVDLVPRTDAPPYLHDGSVIAMSDTSVPQAVGPVLDQVNSLLSSIPKDKLNALLDETFKGLNGAGYDFGSLTDSTSTLSHDFNSVADRFQTLINNSAPLLDSQVDTQQSIRTWARSLAGVTDQLVHNDPQLRTVLTRGPEAPTRSRTCSPKSNPPCRYCWPTSQPSAKSASPITPPSNKSSFWSRRSSRPSKPRYPATTPQGYLPAANSQLPSATPIRAPSDSSRPRNGAHQPTPPPSTPPTGSTANCPKTRLARCAAHATTHAWATRQTCTHRPDMRQRQAI